MVTEVMTSDRTNQNNAVFSRKQREDLVRPAALGTCERARQHYQIQEA